MEEVYTNMIFVCVGSRDYQFNRLLKEIDVLLDNGIIKEKVFAQIAKSDYTPRNYEWKRFLDKKEFEEYQNKASLIITHAGTGAVIGALKKKKQVIAVPRLAKYGEHIDDHQTQVARVMADEGYLKTVTNIKDLGKAIEDIKKHPITKEYKKQSNIIDIICNFIDHPSDNKYGPLDDDKLVSIIIPCYNAEKTIDDTLYSLTKQTYKNIEIICINDGSTDGTIDVLKKWKDYNNIVIIDQKNTGVGRARNNGIKKSSGDYLLFVDSDDVVNEEYIELLVKYIDESDVSYCRLSRKRNKVIKDHGNIKIRHENIKNTLKKLLYEMKNYGFYCFMYKKTILNKYNIFFDENTKYGEDREFIWKYICHCENAAWINAPLYYYAVNPESVTQKESTWRKTDSLKAVRRTEIYLKTNNCPYYKQYKKYMFARVMWSAAKMFSVNNNEELYRRLQRKYDVKACMKITRKDRDILVRIASRLYLINPNLFYNVVKTGNKIIK